MADFTSEESTFKLSDRLAVYTKTWKPATTHPLAHIVLLHGFSDHCNAYYTFPGTLASRGITVFSFDQRGWGKTSPNKANWGDSGPTAQLISDIDDILLSRLTAHPGLPLFLVGHSMGGGVALTYGYQGAHRRQLAGVAVWSPIIRLAPESRPWTVVAMAGKFASRFMPTKQIINKLPPQYMSRDETVCKDFSEDPLCHDTGTLESISEMLERGKWLASGAANHKFEKSLSLLVAHGEADKVTDHNASKNFVENVDVKDKKFLQYDGWFHKLHAEPGDDKIRFVNEMADWILARCNGPQSSTTSKL